MKLVLHNNGRKTVTIDHSIVLAGLHSDSDSVIEALVGPSGQSEIRIGNSTTRCLIDSGSQVSICSESFFRKHLCHLELEELDKPLTATGAGGL